MEKQVKKSSSFYNFLKTRFNIEHIIVEKPDSMPKFHYHNKYELYYLRSGARNYFIKDLTYSVTPGCFVLINKNDIHCTGILSNSPYERFVIYFDDSFIENMLSSEEKEELLSLFKMDIGTVEIPPEQRQLIEAILESMLEYSENEYDGKEAYFKAALLHILLIIKKASATQPRHESCEAGSTHKTASKIVG